MNADIKTRWLAALRSDAYHQTTGQLRGLAGPDATIGHCCLGVLCELAVQDGAVSRDRDAYGWADGRLETLILPSAVRDWAGLSQRNPEVLRDWQLRDDEPGFLGDQLSGLNDGGLSFDQIADVIEREL